MTLKIKVVGNVDVTPMLECGYQIVNFSPDLIVMEYSEDALQKASKITRYPVYMVDKEYRPQAALDCIDAGCAGYGVVGMYNAKYLGNCVKMSNIVKTAQKLQRVG